MLTVSIKADWFPIYLGNRALIGLLNKSVVGLGSPTPVGIDLICNKARLMSSLFSRHFDDAHSQILCVLLLVLCCGDGMMW